MASQFSVLLRRLRRRSELTQEDLADRAGLSERTIRRLETGERANPQLDTVRLLADALGLGPDERAQLLAVADGQLLAESPGVNGNGPESAFQRRLVEAADDLALAVGARLGREEELRRIQDPFPLPVRWELAPDGVLDHWENICRASPGASARPLDLAGRLPEIADVYRRIPSGRLVVLGRAGSGKSVLAARFVLDWLRARDRGGVVPVVFGSGPGTRPPPGSGTGWPVSWCAIIPGWRRPATTARTWPPRWSRQGASCRCWTGSTSSPRVCTGPHWTRSTPRPCRCC
ncbi:helix-turn-helix domain-containing protein [Actinophytocola sp.]|uniref:helix-turn-helix transcriptional regulator n=1 Tax=Actinophytocola sp. TaxID=1872138 RepID=UPI003D6A66D1